MNYNVTMAAIREYNRMSNDVVYEGMPLIIPLCERKPTAGPTPTATPAPPYPAPNLLLPRSGAAFNAATNAITLQWASVADLRENELYRVTVDRTLPLEMASLLSNTCRIPNTSSQAHIERWMQLLIFSMVRNSSTSDQFWWQ
jgi:hypothetical protein